jgi:hypothetical protein
MSAVGSIYFPQMTEARPFLPRSRILYPVFSNDYVLSYQEGKGSGVAFFFKSDITVFLLIRNIQFMSQTPELLRVKALQFVLLHPIFLHYSNNLIENSFHTHYSANVECRFHCDRS